ncbi:hypothetical protein OG946_00135 [Streptomyces sp. NBC_01808]|uniref:MmyB family transcriptional regulator n=1 Tax=Streptomyces sp. NBC_01808 TaxID=2975947 RepID=UPI002DDB89FA|nr:hypothetical protein [Streptomyces sp. NBC_01808]WSA42299.1 hypothetical protein OG946_00135 [Streptomyces sp. NBC_01808]
MLTLTDTWPHNPALVHNHAYDVLASNTIADALLLGRTYSRNPMETVFTDPAARSFYRDWHDVTRNSIAASASTTAPPPKDPRIRQVLTGPLETSPKLTELRVRHDARSKALEHKRIAHPAVDPLTLTTQTFGAHATPGQEPAAYHAEPDSPSAETPALLGPPTPTPSPSPSPN